MSQALQISQTTSYPWMTIEFHFYGLHWETSIILQVWHYLGHSQPAHQASNLYPCPWHHHIHRLSTSVCLHVSSKHSILSHVTSDRGSEFVSNSLFFRHCSQHTASLHFTLGYHPEGDGQTEWWIRLLSNISMYIVTTSKTTGLNFYLLWSLPTIML